MPHASCRALRRQLHPQPRVVPPLARLRPRRRTRRPRLDRRAGPRPHPGLPALAVLPAQPHPDPPPRRRAAGRSSPTPPPSADSTSTWTVCRGTCRSFDFLPAWTRTWHRRNLFTDPDVLDGQAAYLRTLAAALADRPNFIGMTLGNEVNQFSAGPHPDPDRVDARRRPTPGCARMLAACEEGAPGKLHLHAEYDATWYQDDQPFTPAQAARLGAVTAVHSWVFNGTAQRHGRTGRADRTPRRLPDRAEQGVGRRPAPAGLAPGGRRARAPRPRRARRRLHRGDRRERPGLPRPVGRSPGGARTTCPATSPTSPNSNTGSAC